MKKRMIAFGLLASLSLSLSASANINTFADSFSSTQTQSWETLKNGFVVKDGVLTSENYGIQILSGDYSPSAHYSVSMVVDSQGGNGNQPMIFGYKDADSPFYSFRLKTGTWGKWSVYKHEHMNHAGTPILAQSDTPYDANVSHKLSVTMKNKDIFLSVDDERVSQFVFEVDLDSNRVGIYGLMPSSTTVDNFIVTSHDTYSEDFQINLPSTFDYSNYSSFDTGNGSLDGLAVYGVGNIISNESFVLSGKYKASMTWSTPDGVDGQYSQGLMFNYTSSDAPYYTLVLKQGEYGLVALYQHANLADVGGTLVSTTAQTPYNSGQDHTLEVRVDGDTVTAYVDGEYSGLMYTLNDASASPKVGIQVRVVDDSIIKNMTITR